MPSPTRLTKYRISKNTFNNKYNTILKMRKNIIRSAHQIATKYYIKQLKTSAQQLQKQALRLKFIKLKKLINYYLSRGTYLQTYAARLKGSNT